MPQYLHTVTLMENKNLGGGIASEKWYWPYTSDKAALTLMDQLGDQRSKLLPLHGAIVREVRGSVIDVAPNGLPIRNHSLPSAGFLTGGWKPTSQQSFNISATGASTGKNTGPTVALSYSAAQVGTRYTTLAFAPAGASFDFLEGRDVKNYMSAAGTAYYQMVASYYRFLIRNGAMTLVQKPTSQTTRYPIVMVTSGNPITPVLATVVVAGDQTGIFTPGIPCVVSQRRAQRGLGQGKFRELNGTHTVMGASFNSTTNMTTVQLTCTLNVNTNLCRSSGFIRAKQWTFTTLLDADASVQARGRRSRKNVVQV